MGGKKVPFHKIHGFFLFFELRKILPEIQEKYKGRKLHLRKYKEFRYVSFLNIRFLKYKKSSFMSSFWIFLSWSITKVLSWNIRRFRFLKYKEFFSGFIYVSRNIRSVSSIRASKFNFQKYKEFFSGWIFLKFFWAWVGKCAR